jgi:hypothetical protein
MSAGMSAAAKLVRLGGELGAAALEGTTPNPAYLAQQLVLLGIEAVGADALRGYLDAAAAARVDAEVDAEMRAKLGQ